MTFRIGIRLPSGTMDREMGLCLNDIDRSERRHHKYNSFYSVLFVCLGVCLTVLRTYSGSVFRDHS